MTTVIKPKRSNTSSAIPTTSDLADGELAVNTADGKIYLRVGNDIIVVANTAEAGVSGLSDVVDDTTPQLGGDLDTNGSDITFGDNDKAIFGASTDLQIYHDGSNSAIQNATGELFIYGGSDQIRIRAENSEESIVANPNGSVNLYHNGSAKISTTSTGVDVTGTVTADGLTVDGDAVINLASTTGTTLGQKGGLELFANSSTIGNGGELTWQSGSGSTETWAAISGYILANDASGSRGHILFGTKNATTDTVLSERMRIANNGDISFYEDTGTTTMFFWDASAESLGIGTITPASKLDVAGNVAVSGTVDGRDIATDGTKLDGIETGATADQTASEILTAIKTVDGSGSGLDADLLDGLQASQFLRSDANDTTTGNLTISVPDDGGAPADTAIFNIHGYEGRGAGIKIKDSVNSASGANDREWFVGTGYSQTSFSIAYSPTGTQSSYSAQNKLTVDTTGNLALAGTSHTADGNTIWHAGNDGSGSGLDADLLDGVQGSAYARLDDPTFTGTPDAPTAATGTNTTQIATTAFVQQEIAALKALLYAYDQS